ncbi:hypothetical protein Q1W71_12055 [Flavobacterium pectinovorum]|uniref:hypothetical protein n=1 Tax=Flavobacterium pectinovorum TaxID=29533 RepID=UPI00265F364B|nr:hypothetical protein [Flavobacterium pectinovorum]WKL50478.1 hypothetical protein Q1W71_12055 [Flavobacterium pectinovorum]
MKTSTEQVEIETYNLEPIPRNVGVETNDDIFVTVSIVNGQTGWSVIKINGNQVKAGVRITNYQLDRGQIQDSEVLVETNITTINPHESKKCRLITTFQNQTGSKLAKFVDDHEASNDGYAKFIAKYRIVILALLFFTTSLNSFAQDSKVDISTLETPTSPAFILLDDTPESVERPTTPQGVATSFLGAFNGAGGAVEVAPYWLAYRDITAEQMIKKRFPFKQFLSFSFANVKGDSATYVTGGIRARIFQYQNTKRKSDALKLYNEIGELSADPIKNHDAIQKKKKEYQKLLSNPSFSINFASAIAAGSVDNSYDNLSFARWGSWINFDFNFSKNTFNILSRFITNEKLENYEAKADLIDIGAKYSYDFGRLNLGMEYVQRFNIIDDTDEDYRIAGIGKYQLMDNVYLTASFGKNFTDVDNVIALAGISFGYSAKQ